MDRKTVNVAAAVIIRSGKVFAAQRGYGSHKGWWEFPGGKIEDGETPTEALEREISEELGTAVEVGNELAVIEYDYPEFHLHMHCYVCTIVSGSLTLLEHMSSEWLDADKLESVKWLPADRPLIPLLKKLLAPEI